jgi:hypothetical protein
LESRSPCRWGATTRMMAATVAVLSLTASCASLANTPAQDLALSRWTDCSSQVSGAQLRYVEPDGRMWFWYSGAGREAMLDCLRKAAKGGAALPEPIADPRPGAGGGM